MALFGELISNEESRNKFCALAASSKAFERTKEDNPYIPLDDDAFLMFSQYYKGDLDRKIEKEVYNTIFKGHTFEEKYRHYLELKGATNIKQETSIRAFENSREETRIDLEFDAEKPIDVTLINENCKIEKYIIPSGSKCLFELKSGQVRKKVLKQIESYFYCANKWKKFYKNREFVVAVVLSKRYNFNDEEKKIIKELYKMGAIVIRSDIGRHDIKDTCDEIKHDYNKHFLDSLQQINKELDININPSLEVFKMAPFTKESNPSKIYH